MCLPKGSYETPSLSKTGQPGADAVIALIKAGEAIVTVEEGKRKRQEFHKTIKRAFGGVQGPTVARLVIAAAKEDSDLARAARDQDIDFDQMSEDLDEGDRYARENPKGKN